MNIFLWFAFFFSCKNLFLFLSLVMIKMIFFYIQKNIPKISVTNEAKNGCFKSLVFKNTFSSLLFCWEREKLSLIKCLMNMQWKRKGIKNDLIIINTASYAARSTNKPTILQMFWCKHLEDRNIYLFYFTFIYIKHEWSV